MTYYIFICECFWIPLLRVRRNATRRATHAEIFMETYISRAALKILEYPSNKFKIER